MPAIRIKVTYIGGREETIKITPRAQTEAEEKFHGFMNDESAVRTSYWLAWRSLHQAGKESADYETWLDKIEDAESVSEKEDANAVDPTTGEAPSPNGSLPSVSEPVSASTT
jgi:hypothetical protein